MRGQRRVKHASSQLLSQSRTRSHDMAWDESEVEKDEPSPICDPMTSSLAAQLRCLTAKAFATEPLPFFPPRLGTKDPSSCEYCPHSHDKARPRETVNILRIRKQHERSGFAEDWLGSERIGKRLRSREAWIGDWGPRAWEGSERIEERFETCGG